MSGCANCGNPKTRGDLPEFCTPCRDALQAQRLEKRRREEDTANHCACSVQDRLSAGGLSAQDVGDTCGICGRYVSLAAQMRWLNALHDRLQALHAHNARVAQALMNGNSAERSHAGLFMVSPLAWAIKKTWNGKPKRR